MFKDFLDLVKEQSEVDQDTTFATTGRVCAHVQSRSLGAVHAMATSTEGQRTQRGETYDGRGVFSATTTFVGSHRSQAFGWDV